MKAFYTNHFEIKLTLKGKIIAFGKNYYYTKISLIQFL